MNATQAQWDQVWTTHIVTAPHDSVVRQILKLGVERALEVGAGSGRDVEALHAQGLRILYSDFSAAAVRAFVARCPTIPACQVDATRMPFPDGSFELVYSLGLLEHFDLDVRAQIIAEHFRVASRYVLIDVPQRWAPACAIKKTLMAVGRWPYGWETEYSYRGLIEEVRSVCPEARVVDSYGRELFPLPRNMKNRVYRALPDPVRSGYLRTLDRFAFGLAGSMGVVFAVPDAAHG